MSRAEKREERRKWRGEGEKGREDRMREKRGQRRGIEKSRGEETRNEKGESKEEKRAHGNGIAPIVTSISTAVFPLQRPSPARNRRRRPPLPLDWRSARCLLISRPLNLEKNDCRSRHC